MKARFAKALVLVMLPVLVLSGCNLIEIDAKMQADEDIARIDARYSKAAASYDGGEITVSEAVGDFNSYYNEMAYMYYYFGYDMTDEDVHMIAEDVLSERVRAEITAAKFDEAHTLTGDEVAAMEEEIRFSYEENLAGALEAAAGDTDEQKQEYARVLLREFGADYDTLYSVIQTGTKAERMQEILRGEITEVSQEDLQAAYEEKIAVQMETFTDGSSFESAMTGDEETVCWMPDGYRTVKHILLMLDDTVATAYSSAVTNLENARYDLEILEAELFDANDDDLAEGARTPEEIQAEIDAVNAGMAELETAVKSAEQIALLSVVNTTDEIYARLEGGERFEDLIAEYGEDPGMQNEPTMSRGYYVSAASQQWEPSFRDAAMALENVGDYTASPVLSGSGVHIIQYVSDVPAGAVDMEEVRDALTAETLAAMQEAHSEEIISAWVEAANPSYDVEGFEAAIFEE